MIILRSVDRLPTASEAKGRVLRGTTMDQGMIDMTDKPSSVRRGVRRTMAKDQLPGVAPENDNLNYDMDDALGFMFRRLNSLSTALFISQSGQSDITPLQMGILVKVHRAGLLSLRSLASEMHVDKSTLQEVVKRMVDRHLLSRRTPERDKRTHELWLGPEGLRELRTHRKAMGEVQERLLEDVPPGDAAVTLRTLRSILDRHGY